MKTQTVIKHSALKHNHSDIDTALNKSKVITNGTKMAVGGLNITRIGNKIIIW